MNTEEFTIPDSSILMGPIPSTFWTRLNSITSPDMAIQSRPSWISTFFTTHQKEAHNLVYELEVYLADSIVRPLSFIFNSIGSLENPTQWQTG